MFQAEFCRKRFYVVYLQREKPKNMNFKRIVHAAVARWQAQRRARFERATVENISPATDGRTADGAAEPAPKADGKAARPATTEMEERLEGFLSTCYDFRFNLLTEVTEFRPRTEGGKTSFRRGRGLAKAAFMGY